MSDPASANSTDPLGKRNRPAVAIFASSREESSEARELGQILASRGYLAVTGGGPGAMASLAEGVRSGGGETVAVSVEGFSIGQPELLTRVILRPTLIDRIQFFIEHADAFVALPGGTGTLAELALAWEFVNKELVPRKPIVVMGAHWNPLIGMLHREPGAPDPHGLATAAAQHIHRAKTPLEAATILGIRLGR